MLLKKKITHLGTVKECDWSVTLASIRSFAVVRAVCGTYVHVLVQRSSGFRESDQQEKRKNLGPGVS